MDIKQIDRYQIVGQLGRGGMATVFHAHDPNFKRDVAIKVLPREFLHEESLRARFEREAHTIAALEHSAIVPVYDFGEHEGQPFLVIRLMNGGSLAQRLEKGSLSFEEAGKVLTRIGAALDYAHKKGVVHRDLKPANILFDQFGDAYLADFGIAWLAEAATTLTGTSAIVGTPAYMSPEQIHADVELDGRSDIYALGIILFEMLSGQPPYQAETPTKVMMKHLLDPIPSIRGHRPDLPPECEQIITKVMAKDREERFPSASSLIEAFDRVTKPGQPTPDTILETVTETPSPPQFIEPTPLLEPPDQVESIPISPPDPRPKIPLRTWGMAGLVLVGVIAIGAVVFNTMNNRRRAAVATAEVKPSPSSSPILAASPTVTPESGTATPGIGSLQVSDKDGMRMVFVPAGQFVMGSSDTDPNADDDERPQHIVFLDSYWIDQTEVSVAQYQLCVKQGFCNPPQEIGSLTRDRYYNDKTFDSYPVIWVDWEAANTYCLWAGRRLPTEAEWEKASRGVDGFLYPWGNNPLAGNLANTCDRSCTFNWREEAINDGYEDTAPVISHMFGASLYDVFNTVGNVWEWTADFYDPDYYSYSPAENPLGPTTGSTHTLRGGSFQNTAEYVRSATRNRDTAYPENLYHVGFRCALSGPGGE